MSSELQGTSTGDRDSDPEVPSGHELHDSDAEGELNAVWAFHRITNETIIAALTDRVYRHLNAVIKLDKRSLTDDEYNQRANDLALLEARQYAKKRDRCGTSNASLTSSRSRASTDSVAINRWEGKRPTVMRSPETGSPAPRTQNMASQATTIPTESTSQESGPRSLVRPPPANWGERVRLQRARNGDLNTNGSTSIPDQEVIFQESCPYDMRARSPLAGDHDAQTTDAVVKEESVQPPVHRTPRPLGEAANPMKRTRFIGNTSIIPMSQQYYPGRLNRDCDTLLGSRYVDNQEGESEHDEEPWAAPQASGRPE